MLLDFSQLDPSSLSYVLDDTLNDSVIIPRSYQIEMFQRAVNGNVIAVLDTGSGKTLIACLLIKHLHNIDFTLNKKRISIFVSCTYD